MWLLKVILFVVFAGVMVWVALGNDTPVDVDLFGSQLLQVPLFSVIFGAAAFGLLVGLGFAGMREIQWKLKERRQGRSQRELEKEIQQLRQAPVAGLGDDPAPGSTFPPENPA